MLNINCNTMATLITMQSSQIQRYHTTNRNYATKLTHLVHEANARRFERILLWQMYTHFPHTSFVRSPFRTEEFDYELVQSIENCDFMFGLDQFDDVCIHPPLSCTWRGHLDSCLSLSVTTVLSVARLDHHDQVNCVLTTEN